MKLLTKEIQKQLIAARAKSAAQTEGFDENPIVVKFFTPDANCTWFITDGEKQGDDWEFFGLCDLGLGTPELGYVRLSELQKVRGRFGLPIEREKWFTGTMADAKKEVRAVC
jgi:hypothetical protein